MAKRKLTPKDDKKEKQESRILTFIKSSTTHYLVGIIILALALYAGIAMVSFFFTGAADQSKIESGVIDQASNWTGTKGAKLSHFLMTDCFGISMFFLLAFCFMAGLRLMKAKYTPLLRQFIICSLLTIWTSIALSFFFGSFFKETAVYIGGKHGLVISAWLDKEVGIPGTFLILLVSLILILILITPKTTTFLSGISSSPKWKSLFTRKDKPEKVKREKRRRTQVQEEEEEPFIPEETEPTILVVEQEDKLDPFTKVETDEFEVVRPADEEYIEIDSQTSKKPTEPEFQVTMTPDEAADRLVEELGVYDPTLDLAHYEVPTLDLLKKYPTNDNQIDMEEQNENKNKIIQTLAKFNVHIKSIKATVGPTITLYEIVPEDGIKIAKIRGLEDDIAMNLAALGIRIIAPIPGKGTIGIEVPNKEPQIVPMHSIIASKKFQESKMELPLAMGKTITNEVFMVDLAKLPHLLVAGATGQGKSVGLNAAITSLLYKKHPSELKFVMIDPKMVEFSIYSVIEKHFLAKLPDEENAIITDFTKVIQTLNSLTKEMDDRYSLLNLAGARNIKEYNNKFVNRRLNPQKGHKFMPYIVVVIDEFGDLIMTAGKEIELPIARIAQKARAVGIHMIIATQRPTTNIITGTIKANFPARIAFRVMAMVDSRTILDRPGANQLVGRGDMLFTQGGDIERVQCAFVDTPEVDNISKYIGTQQGFITAFELPEFTAEGGGESAPGAVDLSNRDPMFEEAARLIVIHQQGSTSLIQRKMQLGYNRAGRLMDQLEAAGIVGPTQGSKPREVYIQDEYQLEQLLNNLKQ